MMPPARIKIHLKPRVTLIFNLLTTKVDHFMHLPVDHLCQLASKVVHSFLKYWVHTCTHTHTWYQFVCPLADEMANELKG